MSEAPRARWNEVTAKLPDGIRPEAISKWWVGLDVNDRCACRCVVNDHASESGRCTNCGCRRFRLAATGGANA